MAAEGTPVEIAEKPEFAFPVPEGDFQKFTDLPWLSCTSGDACGLCCKACWCPCLVMKQSMKDIEFEKSAQFQGFLQKIDIWTAVFFTLTLVWSTIASIIQNFLPDMPIVYYIFSIMTWVFKFAFMACLLKWRGYVAKQFNLDFCNGVGCCFDCCCTFFCWCWTLPQELKSIEEYKPKEDGGIIGEAINAASKVVKQIV